jgi:hypothetical protein
MLIPPADGKSATLNVKRWVTSCASITAISRAS